MPFTFAHPAIILPLYRFRHCFSLTGLIIGSMAPDFEYFLRMRIINHYGHHFSGLFFFNIPTSIFVAFIFHHIIRNRLIDNLPNFLYQRLAIYKSFNWADYFRQHYLIILSSVLIGNLSHVIWDAFTHPSGFFVDQFTWLRTELCISSSFTIPLYKILQHGSSLIGIMYILLFILLMPRIILSTPHLNIYYWLAILLLTILIIMVRIAFNINSLLIGNLIATTIMASFLSLTIVSIILRHTQIHHL